MELIKKAISDSFGVNPTEIHQVDETINDSTVVAVIVGAHDLHIFDLLNMHVVSIGINSNITKAGIKGFTQIPVSLSEHDQLETATKSVAVSAEDVSSYQDALSFYHRMSGKIEYSTSVLHSVYGFLTGKIDLVMLTNAADDAVSKKIVAILKRQENIRIETKADGRLSIDTGLLSF